MWRSNMKGSLIGLGVVIMLALSPTEGVLPGMKTRITPRGLEFVRIVAMKKMESTVVGQAVPSQSGGPGYYSYRVYNMYVADFDISESQIYVTGVTQADVEFYMDFVIDVKVVGDYSIHILGIYHTSGRFQVTLSSLRISLTISLGATYVPPHDRGVPHVQLEGCAFSFGYIIVDLSGHSGWDGKAEAGIIDYLNKHACVQVDSMIRGRLRQELEQLSMEVMFYHEQFGLDYSLLTSPGSYNGTVEMKHKGQVNAVQSHWTPGLPVQQIPEDPEESEMFYVWITDFLVNSAGYAFHDTEVLRYVVDQSNAPPSMSMNTSGFPIKMVFPQVTKLYPGLLMQFTARSSAPPGVNTTKDRVTSYAYADIDAYVTQPNKPPTYLFTLSLNISLSFQLGMKEQNVTWISKLESADLDLVKSTISDLKIRMLKTMLQPALNKYVMPELNKRGADGYPLPDVKGFSLMGTNITQGDGFLKVATDMASGHLFSEVLHLFV